MNWDLGKVSIFGTFEFHSLSLALFVLASYCLNESASRKNYTFSFSELLMHLV